MSEPVASPSLMACWEAAEEEEEARLSAAAARPAPPPPPPPRASADLGRVRSTELAPTPGALADRFEVDWSGNIGEGAFATVWKGRDKQSGDFVAVKQVKKSELSVSQQRRFKKEVALMLLIGDDNDGVGGEGGEESKTAPQGGVTTTGGEASASSSSSCSKGVVQLIGWYDEGSSYFAVMELLEGGELFDHIHKERRYEESEARSIARTLMATLVALGNKGIVSRQLWGLINWVLAFPISIETNRLFLCCFYCLSP